MEAATHGLDTDSFTLSTVEVIGASRQLFKVHVLAVNKHHQQHATTEPTTKSN